MSILDFFRKKKEEPKAYFTQRPRRNTSFNKITKYGNIRYTDAGDHDYMQLRENGRGVHDSSSIARGIVTRLVDNVINTGLTWESSPLWSMIPQAPRSEEERHRWTEQIENMWALYSRSKEPDVRGRLTLSQLQRTLYAMRIIEGEYFVVLRYLNGESRTNPIALQIIGNDQIDTPYDAATTAGIKNRGNTEKHGIEYDQTGKAVAIFVNEQDKQQPTRIPFFGPRSGRRFVIHDGNFEGAEQYRGFPELSRLVYELDRLTEYDISELEAVVASALWMGVVESDKDASPGKGPKIKPNTSTTGGEGAELQDGIETVEIGKRSLIMNNLPPGYTFKGFQPTRPNPNYENFVKAFETRIAGSLGMPLSVLRQQFQGSYSAARAEILFFWNSVFRRRDDFISGFLRPFYEAWFTELVRSGDIEAPGYLTRPMIKKAWLYGSWNGISRPVVDPLKEVNAVATRLKLGHTTGERESKAYNGSDFRSNIEKLRTENKLRSDANLPVDPELVPIHEDDDDEGEEDG